MEELDVREEYPLGNLTTLRVGGPARYFAVARTEADAIAAVRFARDRGAPVFVLGGGSNVLISDGGYRGMVLKNEIAEFAYARDGDSVLVRVGGGETWDSVAERCVVNGWQGIECLSGIPGTAGAAPLQNLNAYGQAAGDAVEEVRAVDCRTGELRVFGREQCAFSYRTSVFKQHPGAYCITQITLRLRPRGETNVSYYDLQRHFAALGRAPTLMEMRRAVLDVRGKKGLVMLPGYETFRSAGSFFLNPVVPQEKFGEIKRIVERWRETTLPIAGAPRGGCPDPWNAAQPDGNIKIMCACILEVVGFRPGYCEGNVGISPKHALSIVAYEGATAAEVKAFAERIQEQALAELGITLIPEVQYIGFDDGNK